MYFSSYKKYCAVWNHPGLPNVIFYNTFVGTGALFHGSLSTKQPADKSVKSGYCAIRSKPKQVYMYIMPVQNSSIIRIPE